jgi:hypothetical protein
MEDETFEGDAELPEMEVPNVDVLAERKRVDGRELCRGSSE